MGKGYDREIFDPSAWMLNNQQGFGETSQPVDKISDGFGDTADFSLEQAASPAHIETADGSRTARIVARTALETDQ